ncbi:hypothetical protein HYR99_14510 [Candidatus Poribacteria bacterium]|nr:hypothetical protein [Candidatus Poribacteria bacterium]
MRPKAIAAATQYRGHTTDMSSIINQLFENYRLEGLIMPYTMEDFRRDVAREYLSQLTVDEILQQFSLDEILQRIFTDERLRGLSVNDILQRLSTDERLRGLSADEIRAYLEKLEGQQKA